MNEMPQPSSENLRSSSASQRTPEQMEIERLNALINSMNQELGIQSLKDDGIYRLRLLTVLTEVRDGLSSNEKANRNLARSICAAAGIKVEG